MINIDEVRKVNEDVLLRSMEKVKKSLNSKMWDSESFEVMNEALSNIYKIDRYEEKSQQMMAMTAIPMAGDMSIMGDNDSYNKMMGKKDAKTETTEFEALIYDIANKKPGHEGMMAITTILAEHMEDMRILNNRAYKQVMMKLKELI